MSSDNTITTTAIDETIREDFLVRVVASYHHYRENLHQSFLQEGVNPNSLTKFIRSLEKVIEKRYNGISIEYLDILTKEQALEFWTGFLMHYFSSPPFQAMINRIISIN
ncbi:MAG TPA: hypothetical protein PKL83_00160 [bacterium]|nr:hypothetical protein [bacterium]